MAGLIAEGLSKAHGRGALRQQVLNRLRLRLAPARSCAILGPSGSGKSTLLQLVCGLQQPDHGIVRIDDFELTAASEAKRSRYRGRHIGVVFQDFNLLDSLDATANVALAGGLNGLSTRVASERAGELLDRLGLQNQRQRRPGELSGGEQQRVAIARAMITQPTLILADEPTGNLDADTARDVSNLLFEQARANQAMLIFATHSESLAGQADEQMRLQDGQLVTL